MMLLAMLLLQTLTIAPGGSDRIQLEVFKTGLMNGKKHVFLFTQYKGTLEYDADAPERSRIELHIQSASAQCQDTWVSDKDKKKIQEFALTDMLDAAHHPEITFRSASILPKSADVFEAHGTLTIRGAAKPSVVTVIRKPGGVFEGSATVKHTDYGLKPSKAALGTIGTKDEMTVSFILTGRSFKAAATAPASRFASAEITCPIVGCRHCRLFDTGAASGRTNPGAGPSIGVVRPADGLAAL